MDSKPFSKLDFMSKKLGVQSELISKLQNGDSVVTSSQNKAKRESNQHRLYYADEHQKAQLSNLFYKFKSRNDDMCQVNMNTVMSKVYASQRKEMSNKVSPPLTS